MKQLVVSWVGNVGLPHTSLAMSTLPENVPFSAFKDANGI